MNIERLDGGVRVSFDKNISSITEELPLLRIPAEAVVRNPELKEFKEQEEYWYRKAMVRLLAMDGFFNKVQQMGGLDAWGDLMKRNGFCNRRHVDSHGRSEQSWEGRNYHMEGRQSHNGDWNEFFHSYVYDCIEQLRCNVSEYLQWHFDTYGWCAFG